jgi:hypothetical protein
VDHVRLKGWPTGAAVRRGFDPPVPVDRRDCSSTVSPVEDLEGRRGKGKRTKIKLPDRIAALIHLGKVHGMFKNETTLNGGRSFHAVLSSTEAAL